MKKYYKYIGSVKNLTLGRIYDVATTTDNHFVSTIGDDDKETITSIANWERSEEKLYVEQLKDNRKKIDIKLKEIEEHNRISIGSYWDNIHTGASYFLIMTPASTFALVNLKSGFFYTNPVSNIENVFNGNNKEFVKVNK